MARTRMYSEISRNGREITYPGCFYYELKKGDRAYYCMYRKDGKLVTAKYGLKSKGKNLRGCNGYREKLMVGEEKTRQQERAEKKAVKARDIVHLYNDHYLKDRNGKGRTDSLFNNWVKPHWVGKDIEKATNQDAANYRIWLESRTSKKGTPLSPQSIKHCIGLYRRVLRHAKRHIKGFVLLIDDFSVPVVFNEKTEDLTPEELVSLLKVLNAESILVKRADGKTYPLKVNRLVADMMLLVLNTGMRRGEVLKLQWQHVNFDRGTILLKEPKGGKDVVIPMSSGARALLRNRRKASMFVFPGEQGGKRLYVHKQATLIRDLAGLPKSFRPFHGLRHYFGTELAACGANITVISELMGHKGLEITKRYVKARHEQKREAVELVSIGGEK